MWEGSWGYQRLGPQFSVEGAEALLKSSVIGSGAGHVVCFAGSLFPHQVSNPQH